MYANILTNNRASMWGSLYGVVVGGQGRRNQVPMANEVTAVQLLGGLQLWRGSQIVRPVEWRTKKNRALLAILVGARGEYFTQDQLVEYLWPEAGSSRAQASLRKRLSEIRYLLEPRLGPGERSRFILTCGGGYSFNREADLWVDLEAFSAKRAEADRVEQLGKNAEAAERYEQARHIYRGEYLPEFRYEEWAAPGHEKWKAAWLDVMAKLTDCLTRLGETRRAIEVCRQVLSVEPCKESFLRVLMELHLLEGEPAMALIAYEHCTRYLEERLGVRPSEELQEMYARIRGQSPGRQTLRPRPEQAKTIQFERLPLVGRESELGRLRAHIQAAAGGRGGMLLLTGEPGVGKSRLLQEVRAAAQEAGQLALASRCSADSLIDYEPLLQAIRDAAPRLSRSQLSQVPGHHLARVAQLVPELRNVAGRLPAAQPPPKEGPREWLVDGMAQLLAGLAAGGTFTPPALLLLDDLQHISSATAALLTLLTERIADCPVLIIGAAYLESSDRSGELRCLLDAPSVNELPLGLLEATAVRAFLRELSPSLGEGFFREIMARTKGHPLYLTSALRTLEADGALDRGLDGEWVLQDVDWERLSAQLAAVVDERLARLAEDDLALLRALAVLGIPAAPALLHGMWPGAGERLDRNIERLVENRLVQVDCRGRYAIEHEHVRKRMVEGLNETQARRLHLQAARAIECLPPSAWWKTLTARAARHFYAAGEWEKALSYSLLALQRAVEEHRADDALRMAGLGLEAAHKLGADRTRAERFQILKLRSHVLEFLGRQEEEARNLEGLENVAEELADPARRAEVQYLRAKHLLKRGAYSQATTHAQSALELWAEADDRAGEAWAANLLGDLLRLQGETDDALHHLQRADSMFTEQGIPEGQASTRNILGVLYRRTGQHTQALNHLEDALSIRRQLGDKPGETQVLSNIANVHWNLGAPRRALKAYGDAAEIYRSLGYQWGEMKARFNEGIVHSDLGDYEAAVASYEASLRLARDIGDRKAEAAVLSDLGTVHGSLGRYDQARECIEQACSILSELGDRHRLGLALHNLAQLRLSQGACEEALQGFQGTLALREELGDRRRQILDLCGLADSLQALGRPEDSLTSLERALAIAQDLDEPAPRLEALWRTAVLLRELGNTEAASDRAREALLLLKQHGPTVIETPQAAYFGCYQALGAEGSKARTVLKSAYDEVISRAERLTDPELKKSYLDSVQLHRKIIEARMNRRTAQRPNITNA